MKSTRRSLFRYLALIGLISTTLSGCFTEDEPPAPQSQITVIHNIPQFPNIQVIANEEVLMEVAPGLVSEPISVGAGPFSLSFRIAGSAESFANTEVINFKPRGYLFALSGDASSQSVIEVTRSIPEVNDGEHAIKVLDLSDNESALKLYRMQDELFELPLEGGESEFLIIESSDLSPLSLIPIEGGGAVSFATAEFPSGAASILLIRNAPESGELDMFLLAL
jgi:hypothetical protein